jgi:diguanylate cyclase (GGDEF)-like protein/PAS domain S-box-containing protein
MGKASDARPPGNPKRWFAPYVVAVALLAVSYFVAGKLALLLAIPPGYATAVWPASGIALGALLQYGCRFWPGILIGSFLVNIDTALDTSNAVAALLTTSLAASVGVGAALQAVVGCALIRRFVDLGADLVQTRSVLGFLALGGPLSRVVSGSWGVGTLWAFRSISTEEVPYSWFTWWAGDTIGVVLVTPLVLIWAGRVRPVWRRRLASVAVPSLAALAAAVVVYVYTSNLEQRRMEAEFDRGAALVGSSLGKMLAASSEIVGSIQSLLALTGDTDREAFRAFVTHALQRAPWLQALSWNPRVTREQRPLVEAQARRQGFPDFVITERNAAGEIVPAAPRDTYVTVLYIEPLEGNRDAHGFDVYSSPARRAALNRARDTGGPVATSRITLVQEKGNQAGVLLLMPIYDRREPPASLSERRDSLLGYAVGVFRLGTVLASALSDLGIRGVEASLVDDDAAGADRWLARYRIPVAGGGEHLPPSGVGRMQPEISSSMPYLVGGRTWRLQLTPTPDYLVGGQSWSAWGVLFVGVSFTGLLSSFLLILTGSTFREERRAKELARANLALSDEVLQRQRMEVALHDAKERAEVTLHSIGDAVITTDPDCTVEYLNPVAERLTEWPAQEAVGRPLESVFRTVDEETREPSANPVWCSRDEGRIIGLANHSLLISRSGREYSIQNSAAPILNREKELVGIVLVFSDVTESRRMAREAVHYATHDALTELANRREFDRRLEHAVASSKQYGTRHALCYLDLDQFKIVNDVAGHRAGDELLKRVALILARGVRERDTVARLGGDEFALLLDNCPIEKAIDVAEGLIAEFRGFKFVWDRRPFDIGASIGIVAIAGQVGAAEELLAHADVACYAAKEFGRNRVHVYQSDSDGSDPRHRETLRAGDMRSALDRNRFRLYGQSIVSLRDLVPVRHELLLRMLDDHEEIVLPGSFVPAAERYHLMGNIDRWVVTTAFRDVGALFPDKTDPLISINLSGNSLSDENLLPFIHSQFKEHGIAPGQVCFEVTETAAMRNLTAAAQVIDAIRDMGGHFALDDFGTGVSSFAYLNAKAQIK